MSRRVKLFLLIGFMIILSSLAVVQSMRVYHALHQVKFAAHRDRQPGDKVQKWTTVAEAAKSLNISEKEVFEALKIDPATGDENLTFRALEKKYAKTPLEMQSNLRQLRERYAPPGKNHE